MSTKVLKSVTSFFSFYKHHVYKKGDILIRADENPTGVFFLKKGIIRMYALSKKGDELVLNIYKQNTLFPLSWTINNTTNKYFYEASTNSEVWKAPKTEFLKFLTNDADVLYDIVSRVFNGIDGLLKRVTHLMSGSAYSRLMIELLIHTKRFGTELNNTNTFEITVTEKQIAAQTGMSRETVSREMQVLKNKGIVAFDKRRLTIELDKLEKELSLFSLL
jgi:CRP/FNR family transcriptional regulator